MKTYTTNYENTFIAIADDCPASMGEMPPQKGDSKSIANIQFELISQHPYKYTSDDVLFQVLAQRKDLTPSEFSQARAEYFSKGQPCLRASPLTKRYGWGVHHNAQGKIAIYGCQTAEYKKLLADRKLTVVKAMKSSR
jgi:hypothetical protein